MAVNTVNRSCSVNRSCDRFLADAYTGQGGFRDGTYLIRHPRESDDKFLVRRQLAVYPNYVKKIVGIYGGFLSAREPNRDGSDLYAEFARDCDGLGTSLDMWLKTQQRRAMIHGTIYIIVDMPAEAAPSRAQQRGPYLSARTPGALVASEQDDRGRWVRAVFQEQVNDITRYREFRLDGWRLSEEADGSGLIAEGTYSFGRLPVVALHSTIPLDTVDLRAQPWIDDLAQANWDLFNQLSELRELFRSQTFSILAFPVADEQEAQRLAGLTVSTENALTYNPAGGGVPQFIAPPDGPVTLYLESIARTIQRIYELANLEFVGGVQQSGVALAFHFQEANRSLGDMASLLEQAEREIAELVEAWNGREFTGSISYPRDFNLADLAEELKTALDAQSLGISPTFDHEMKKRLARSILGHGVAQSTLEDIDREIEAGTDPYGDRVQKEAGGMPDLPPQANPAGDPVGGLS